jgi:hypothetical protein
MYTLSNIRIVQNGIIFRVPCPLVPYLTDIKALLYDKSIQQAFVEVAAKYNIILFAPEPLKRRIQQFPPEPILKSTAQPVDSFILTTAWNTYWPSYDTTSYRAFRDDSRYLTTLNSESPTMTYELLVSKKSSLAYLFKGTFPKAAICVPITENVPIHTGYIMYSDRYNTKAPFVFTPIIHNKLLPFYSPITVSNTAVYFKNIGCSLEQNSREVLYKYTKSTDLNIVT